MVMAQLTMFLTSYPSTHYWWPKAADGMELFGLFFKCPWLCIATICGSLAVPELACGSGVRAEPLLSELGGNAVRPWVCVG